MRDPYKSLLRVLTILSLHLAFLKRVIGVVEDCLCKDNKDWPVRQVSEMVSSRKFSDLFRLFRFSHGVVGLGNDDDDDALCVYSVSSSVSSFLYDAETAVLLRTWFLRTSME